MKKQFIVAVTVSAVLGISAFASNASAASGKRLFMTCTACHGKDGKSPIMPAYPKIAGQNKEYVLQQVKDIMSGKRANGQSMAMKGVLVTPTGEPRFSDEDLNVLADYVSKLAP
ncbi:c-type cytochrome [Thiolapillus brandeum]|uniref:Cytochrome c, class I n=1 Tax=Thiolapillus brandeum TaxID=1076588 RepID=A0A7U6GH98_9GAMM|nr:c-type cytochrome [Thiolapillus brandeum]BAO43558.1 cytochrome c, class I [Thiolapillus brandeum]